MLRLCDIFLNPSMLIIGIISVLLTKIQGEIKKKTVLMDKNVSIGAPNWMLHTIRSLY